MKHTNPTAPVSQAHLERGWVWFSNYETVNQGKISVLAIVESLSAMSVFLWIAMTWGLTHLTISACVAPLLLLRTEGSERFGLNLAQAWLASCEGALRQIGRLPKLIALPIVFTSMALLLVGISVGARIVATVSSAIRHPRTSVRAIPTNWARIVFRVDSVHAEELVPGASAMIEFRSFCPRSLWIAWISEDGRDPSLPFRVLATLALVALSLAAVAYRWSLKGSAFIYIPLLYIVDAAESGSLTQRLTGIRRLLVHKLALCVGVISILAFLSRWLPQGVYAWCVHKLAGAVPFLAEYLGFDPRFFSAIPPWNEENWSRTPEWLLIPRWQVASVANGVIIIGLFLLADWVVQKERELAEETWGWPLRIVFMARAFLSCYAIFVLIHIAAGWSEILDWIEWPKFGDQWWPSSK